MPDEVKDAAPEPDPEISAEDLIDSIVLKDSNPLDQSGNDIDRDRGPEMDTKESFFIAQKRAERTAMATRSTVTQLALFGLGFTCFFSEAVVMILMVPVTDTWQSFVTLGQGVILGILIALIASRISALRQALPDKKDVLP